jgi:L-asparaginase II
MSTNDTTLRQLWPHSSDYQVVAELVRDGLVESRHWGIAALVGPDGKLIEQLGKSKRLIYPRSSVKPLQAVAARRAGLKLEGAQLAITAGSHQGSEAHAQLVTEILEQAGLNVDALQCPLAWPGTIEAAREATEQKRVYFNCSGKHAGFLAASKVAGFSTENYLDPNHPLQKLITEVIEEYTGETVYFTTADGCGAPLHTVTVEGLARAIGKFTSTDHEIVEAMLSNAWAVDGHGTADTLIMEAGLIAKLGAEGVFVVGTREGYGVAVKIADGQLRAAPLVALWLLRKHDLIETSLYEGLVEQISQKVTGGSKVTGRLQVFEAGSHL